MYEIRLIVILNVSDAAFLVASYRRNKFVQECSDMMSITASVLARRSTNPSGQPRRMAQRTTVAAPLIKNRRKFRCPIFEVFPSRALPPVECCRGVSPIHAGDCHQPFGDIIFSCSPGDRSASAAWKPRSGTEGVLALVARSGDPQHRRSVCRHAPILVVLLPRTQPYGHAGH